jgi:hypothetical protein
MGAEMRKFWTVSFTTLLTLAFLVVGNPAAQAFGGEVLGCGYPGSSWSPNQCYGVGGNPVQFAPHYLSGTYSYQWTIKYSNGTPITNTCTGPYQGCISSGCTSTSSTCTIMTLDAIHDKTYIATLQLTQAGQSRTIQASALVSPQPF